MRQERRFKRMLRAHHELIGDFLIFVRSERNVLSVSPHLAFQTAMAQPHDSGPARAAALMLEAGLGPDSWVKWLNRPVTSHKMCEVDSVARGLRVVSCREGTASDKVAVGYDDGSLNILQTKDLKQAQV